MSTGKFEAQAFVDALDAERQSRGLTWKRVAQEAGVPASTLTRMSQGKRPDVDTLAALCEWSGLAAEDFTKRGERRKPSPSSLAQISTLLRADPNLSAEGVQAVEAIVKAAYLQMRRDPSDS